MTRAEAQWVLEALHAAQAAFYAGHDGEWALREVLTEDVLWHVPGRNAVAGDHDGIEAVMAYLARRRDLASLSFRMHPCEVLVGDGDHVAVLTDGTATIAGEEHSWSTVGLYRLRDRASRGVAAATRPRALRPHLDRPDRSGGPMTDPSNVVLATIRAVEERDAEALAELYHDDVEFHDAPSLPYGGRRSGKRHLEGELAAAPGTWFGTWGPLQPTAEERRMDARVVAAHDDEVAVVYRQRALSPTGERFDAPVFALYHVRDGKFARAQMFHYDTAEILAFLERAADAA